MSHIPPFESLKKPRQSRLPVDFPDIGFVRLPQILRVFPISRTAFLTGVRDGLYPKPVRIGAKAVAWKVEDIRAMLTTFGSRA